jgi:microcystin-dependent protein
MAGDKKISQLTELTEPADEDFIPIVDASNTVTKRIRKDNLFAGFLPTGAVMPFAGLAEPTGWLLCNGQAVSRTEYTALFDAIGTTFGVGDGSSTFNVPDLGGRVAVGVDADDSSFNAIGETGGEKAHTLTANEMPSHSHTINQSPHGHGVNDPGHSHNLRGHNAYQGPSAGSNEDGSGAEWAANFETRGGGVTGSGTGISIQGSNANISIANAGSGQAHNNLPPYMALNYIIKI